MSPQTVAPDADPFPYSGPPDLRRPVTDALRRVVDPEVAMNILDVGLVYGVAVDEARVHVQVTMTSAACPMADLIVSDIEQQLDRAVPEGLLIQVELVWEPPWSPERISAAGRAVMGW
jgi:metal-sulfur cluster biosynthetic enzyme